MPTAPIGFLGLMYKAIYLVVESIDLILKAILLSCYLSSSFLEA